MFLSPQKQIVEEGQQGDANKKIPRLHISLALRQAGMSGDEVGALSSAKCVSICTFVLIKASVFVLLYRTATCAIHKPPTTARMRASFSG
jgi:hypothetical protein